MAEQEKRKGAGGKLSRSETVTVRLDPKLRYLAELAARKQRRTVSSFIEWAVETSLKAVDLYEGSGYNGDQSRSVADEADRLWDVDEAERFIKLALDYPSLMTHEEQERWKMLNDSNALGPAKSRQRDGSIYWDKAKLEDEVYPAVRLFWSKLLDAQLAGDQAKVNWVSEMKSKVEAGQIYFGFPAKGVVKKSPTSGFDDLDEIPF